MAAPHQVIQAPAAAALADLPVEYEYPAGFNVGDGRVRFLNQSLKGYYECTASHVNQIRKRQRLLHNRYRRTVRDEARGLVMELKPMRDGPNGLLSFIHEIEELGGEAFPIPAVLAAAMDDLIGTVPAPADGAPGDGAPGDAAPAPAQA